VDECYEITVPLPPLLAMEVTETGQLLLRHTQPTEMRMGPGTPYVPSFIIRPRSRDIHVAVWVYCEYWQ